MAAPAWAKLPLSFDQSVPAEQATVLQADLEVFKNLNLATKEGADAQNFLGLQNRTSAHFLRWFGDRVSTVVGENFVYVSRLHILDDAYPYDHAKVEPILDKAPPVSLLQQAPAKTSAIMTNIGAQIYLRGKRLGQLLELRLDGLNAVAMTSPRVGVIQIGEALFAPFYQINAKKPEAKANAISRLKTLFHEARHSDGNGPSLGFFHAYCPATHSLAGTTSCDRNLNGPYSVGGQMLLAMTSACADCSVAEKEALKLSALESLGRVIRISENGVASTHWDPKPEGKKP